MSAELFDLTREAAKRNANKFGFIPLSEIRDEASKDLKTWMERYKEHGTAFLEQQVCDLVQEIEALKYDR
jgi:uncharacterized protein (UPF0305 family)